MPRSIYSGDYRWRFVIVVTATGLVLAVPVWLGRHIANTAPATMTDRIHQAHAFFQHRTDAQNLTTAAPRTSPLLPQNYGEEHRPGA